MTTPTLPIARPLGASGPSMIPFALGCMGMSGMYGPSDEQESIATIHAALEAGVTLLDTGDFYGQGHNEALLRKALDGRRENALLSVKFGALRGPDGSWNGFDARPVAIKNFLAYSLTRLGVDHIDIYRPARLDPTVPIEEIVGAIADLVKAGYVRGIGLSEVGVDTIRRAHAVHPIVDLQIEYSLVSRSPEAAIFPVLRELGIGCTAYGVLSRGLLSGSVPTARTDFRAYLPRFSGDAGEANRKLVAELQELASSTGHTVSQLAIAWVAGQGDFIVPLLGSRTRAQLSEALGAMSITLTAAQREALERLAAGVTGTRYDANHMRVLDSEK
jgi:aryl-alcohol dehydrogenase-like predicted oxidoreductase